MKEHSQFPEPGEGMDAADEHLLDLLAPFLGADDPVGLELSEATVEALERQIEPVSPAASLRTRFTRVARQAEIDLQFLDAHVGRRRPSLGSYLTFLRRRAEWTVSETAKRLRLDFQWLTELERDALSPTQIPARSLAQLLKRLQGSLELAEPLLLSTIQAPRFVTASGRDSLYRRGAPGSQGRWSEPPDQPQLQENPEYEEQVEAAAQLREQLRAGWRK
jgi:transcriptional regulator with XRE-family HTH domain